MLILYDDPSAFAAQISPSEIQKVIQEYRAWAENMASQGRMRGGEKLKDEGGKQLRLAGGKLKVSDGPFAESKEVVGGYFLIEADDYAQMVELCRDHPQLKYGVKIDIREVDNV
jgi:hypothetical protein